MRWLKLKETEQFDLDSPERTILHKSIIKQKKFLNSLYIDWYNKLKKFSNYNDQGKFLELGSGGGFIKEIMPNIITSDVISLPDIDKVFYGENMPFENESLDGIVMIDVFHHIPDSRGFLSEANRVLKKNGKLVMSEPWNSPWGKFIYQNFHHEPFEPTSEKWTIINEGSLSGANGALPWIVFKRDRLQFEAEYPDLEIEFIIQHTPLRYLLSGGLTMKQLVPDFLFKFMTYTDRILSIFHFSMFAYIIVRKK